MLHQVSHDFTLGCTGIKERIVSDITCSVAVYASATSLYILLKCIPGEFV